MYRNSVLQRFVLTRGREFPSPGERVAGPNFTDLPKSGVKVLGASRAGRRKAPFRGAPAVLGETPSSRLRRASFSTQGCLGRRPRACRETKFGLFLLQLQALLPGPLSGPYFGTYPSSPHSEPKGGLSDNISGAPLCTLRGFLSSPW